MDADRVVLNLPYLKVYSDADTNNFIAMLESLFAEVWDSYIGA